MSVCEILPNLWLGNIKIAQNLKFYEDNKINCVINCSKDIPFYNNNCINIRIAVHDNLEEKEIEKLYTYFDKSADLINKLLLENKNILIHCYAGKQRSASIVSVYLMKYANINLYNSILLIKTKRQVAFTPGINFKTSLIKYEKDLKNKNIL